VKALFGGRSVGDVVQDFSCSFQRQAGRLYVSTEGLFFYSNLFGFEKKIRINYEQAINIGKIRSTSLSIKTIAEEEYIFRSFDNRNLVLSIIMRQTANIDDDTYPEAAITDSPQEDLNTTLSCDRSLDETDNENGSSVPELSVNEQVRAKPISLKAEGKGKGKVEKLGDERPPSSTNVSDEDHNREWKELKQNANGWEAAISNLKLTCKSAQDFFGLFLRDEATNSLRVFLGVMGDKNVTIAKWQQQDKSLARTINYEHKSGIQIAQVARKQNYQQHGKHALLQNITIISGVKGVPKDTFFVEDNWFIESTENGGIILNIKFTVKFTKKTMLKSIIQNRAITEAKEWYRQYNGFLRQKMHLKVPVEEEVPAAEPARLDLVGMISTFAQQYKPDLPTISRNAPLLILVILVLIIYRLKLRVIILEDIVGEFEQRLAELERAQQFHPQLPPVEM